jgi:hypothetical protein
MDDDPAPPVEVDQGRVLVERRVQVRPRGVVPAD